MQNHPLFEIVTTKTGATSIRNKEVNEIMHNPVGPWAEANALYIEQSELKRRLQEPTAEELVVFDVGLGAAANALAVLACVHSLGSASRPLRLVSFERELELLRFALEHAASFEHFQGYETTLQTILDRGHWSDGKITWELRTGDFLELIDREPNRAHLIFFDPYSPNQNQDMWTIKSFRQIRAKSREVIEGGTSLFTYSCATRVRSSMIIAGFYVGYGQATGTKSETTQASTDFAQLKEPLVDSWLNTYRRSHLRHAFDCAPGNEAADDQVIEAYMAKILSP